MSMESCLHAVLITIPYCPCFLAVWCVLDSGKTPDLQSECYVCLLLHKLEDTHSVGEGTMHYTFLGWSLWGSPLGEPVLHVQWQSTSEAHCPTPFAAQTSPVPSALCLPLILSALWGSTRNSLHFLLAQWLLLSLIGQVSGRPALSTHKRTNLGSRRGKCKSKHRMVPSYTCGFPERSSHSGPHIFNPVRKIKNWVSFQGNVFLEFICRLNIVMFFSGQSWVIWGPVDLPNEHSGEFRKVQCQCSLYVQDRWQVCHATEGPRRCSMAVFVLPKGKGEIF
jgi:hypothetical protein